MFFVRKENSPTEVIKVVKGYGHTFPEAYTRWEEDVKGSVSHQRIIRYEFGGLRCVVRSESDGFHKELVGKGENPLGAGDKGDRPSKTESASTGETGSEGASDLSSLPTATSTGSETLENAESGHLTILRKGRIIPQCAVFDLKTRMRSREIDMADILPRL